jgi:hypothetical protein
VHDSLGWVKSGKLFLGVVKLGFLQKKISPFSRNQSNCFGCKFPLIGLGNCHLPKINPIVFGV